MAAANEEPMGWVLQRPISVEDIDFLVCGKDISWRIVPNVQQEILCADEELERRCAGSGVVLGRVAEPVKMTYRCCVVSWVQRLVV